MKNILIAFFISLIIHGLFLINYKKQKKVEKNDTSKAYTQTKDEGITRIQLIQSKILKQENVINEINIKEANQTQKKILNETNFLQEKTLENFLSQKDTANQETLNQIQELYADEYKNLTKVQKVYLEKNFNNFQIITQRVLNRLGYPREAIRLKLSGINTIEFEFHPNGDISDLKIINSSGYSIFDNYSLQLIKIAYKDYPKPKTKTKLRFHVMYRFY